MVGLLFLTARIWLLLGLWVWWELDPGTGPCMISFCHHNRTLRSLFLFQIWPIKNWCSGRLNCVQTDYISDEAEIQIKICPTPELNVHSTMLYHITEGLKWTGENFVEKNQTNRASCLAQFIGGMTRVQRNSEGTW